MANSIQAKPVKSELTLKKKKKPVNNNKEKKVTAVQPAPKPEILIENLQQKNITREERLLELQAKAFDKERLELTFNCLYYYKNFRHYLRKFHTTQEKVVVSQRLEVIDGTRDVWEFCRNS